MDNPSKPPSSPSNSGNQEKTDSNQGLGFWAERVGGTNSEQPQLQQQSGGHDVYLGRGPDGKFFDKTIPEVEKMFDDSGAHNVPTEIKGGQLTVSLNQDNFKGLIRPLSQAEADAEFAKALSAGSPSVTNTEDDNSPSVSATAYPKDVRDANHQGVPEGDPAKAKAAENQAHQPEGDSLDSITREINERTERERNSISGRVLRATRALGKTLSRLLDRSKKTTSPLPEREEPRLSVATVDIPLEINANDSTGVGTEEIHLHNEAPQEIIDITHTGQPSPILAHAPSTEVSQAHELEQLSPADMEPKRKITELEKKVTALQTQLKESEERNSKLFVELLNTQSSEPGGIPKTKEETEKMFKELGIDSSKFDGIFDDENGNESKHERIPLTYMDEFRFLALEARLRITKNLTKMRDVYNRQPDGRKKLAQSAALIAVSMGLSFAAPVSTAGIVAVGAAKFAVRGIGAYKAGQGAEKILRARIGKMRASDDEKSIERANKLEKREKVVKYGAMLAAFALGSAFDIYHAFSGAATIATDHAASVVGGAAEHATSQASNAAEAAHAAGAPASGVTSVVDVAHAASAPTDIASAPLPEVITSVPDVPVQTAAPVDAIVAATPTEVLHSHLVSQGDSLGKLFKQPEFSKLLPGFDNLTSDPAKNNYLMNFFEKLTPEQLKSVNISSGRADLIKIDETINMEKLASFAKDMKVPTKSGLLDLFRRASGI